MRPGAAAAFLSSRVAGQPSAKPAARCEHRPVGSRRSATWARMGAATLALCYVAFTALFVYVNLSSLSIHTFSAMKVVVVDKYNSLPFSGHRRLSQYMADIHTPLELHTWLQVVFQNVTYEEQQDVQARAADMGTNYTGLANATVGGFNRILLVRFTAKRRLLVKNPHGKFKDGKNEYPKVLSGSATRLSHNAVNEDEDRSRICTKDEQPPCFEWQTESSYNEMGGYSIFIDPAEGAQAFTNRLQEWSNASMFDLRLATFVVDLMAYNSNTDLFLHASWIFAFDWAGNCHKSEKVRGFNLNQVANMAERDDYLSQYAIRVILWIFVAFFVLREFSRMYSMGFYQHFRQKGALVDAFSLVMCLIVLLTYQIIESNSIFSEFNFATLFDPSTMANTYSRLVSLGMQIEEQRYIIAFNQVILFIRAVVLVADVQSSLGLILAVLDVCASSLLYFLGMFIMIMLGFVLLAHFIFGSSFKGMSSVSGSFYTTFSMLFGKPVYSELEKVEPVMAIFFYYGFYVFFYLVMVNVFISILMSGYDTVLAKLMERGKEDTVLNRLVEEVKHDFVDRIAGSARAVWSFIYRCPLVDACAQCIWSCVPACSLPNCGTCCRRSVASSEDPSGVLTRRGTKSSSAISTGTKRAFSDPWVLLVIFMANFLVFMYFMRRGRVCYFVSLATLHQPVRHTQWAAVKPVRIEDFNHLQSFRQVRQWADHAILGLYNNTACAVVDVSNGGMSTLQPSAGCDNAANSQQLVQVINKWNIGFMNNTFVRLTIQPSCLVPNPTPRWAAGGDWLRKTPDVDCAETDCTSPVQDLDCRAPDGRSLRPESLPNYNFSKPGTGLGAYGRYGGFVFSLGTTPEQCQAKLAELDEDGWFTPKSASMVFDWITYNGNLDMFTFNHATFSLLNTGVMNKRLAAQTFPLNLNKGGGFFVGSRIASLVLFSIYAFLVLYYILEMALRIRQYWLAGKTSTNFFYNFLTNYWNLSDLLSLGLSIVSIVIFAIFCSLPFRENFRFNVDNKLKYSIPNSDEQRLQMPKSVDPTRYQQEDWYIFLQFERTQDIYRVFLQLAALNSFFISIKVVKYVGNMDAVRVFSDTLNSGKTRNFYFLIIILLLLCGFALFFHIIFGLTSHEMRTWPETILTLITWMVGEFDLTPQLKENEPMALIGFLTFMSVFYFIAVNMFLATMLNVYCDKMGDKDVDSAKKKNRPRHVPIVNYHDKGSLQDEIKPEHLDIKEGEVIVREVQANTQLKSEGVQKGFVLSKVNAKNWKHCKSVQEFFDRLPEEGEINLEFMEKSRTDGLSRVYSLLHHTGFTDDPEDEVHKKATCRNFWRTEGAVTWIWREVGSQEQAEEGEEEGEGAGEGGLDEDEDQAGEGGSDSEDEAERRKAPDNVRKAARRLQTKKRLDALLFSRWSDGKLQRGHDGAIGTGHGWEAFGGSDDVVGQPKEIQYEVDDREIFQLREELDRIPIVGQEAWLDCLIAAMEREMEDDSVITDVLRTSEMQDMSMKNKAGREKKPLQEFYRHADEVLKMLEYKANKKYYQYLQIESELRQEHLRDQNEVLHDYVCELEKEFAKVMETIHQDRAKKEVMLTKLAGLLDKKHYRQLEKTLANVHTGTPRTATSRTGRLSFP